MGARDYDYDQDIDFSDLSDQNQSALEKARSRWGSADVIRGGEKSYDPNSLDREENSAISSQKADENEILSKENSPWSNNVTGSDKGGTHKSRNASSGKGLSKFKGKFGKAPLVAAAGLVGGSGAIVGIFSFMTVGVMPLHITEIITEKFNSTASTTDEASKKLLKKKFQFSGQGVNCATKLTTKCKFGTISDKQLKNLEARGAKPIVEGTDFFGRKKISGYDIDMGDGTTKRLRADNLLSELKSDPRIRTALQKNYYSGRFFSFLDDAYNKLASKIKLVKASPSDADSSIEELGDKIQNESANTKNKASLDDDGNESDDGPEDETADRKAVRKEKNKAHNDFVRKLKEGAEELKNNKTVKKISDFTSEFATKIGGKVFNAVNILDEACEIAGYGFGFMSSVKKTRIDILIKFSLFFLSFSNMIKAGQASPEIATMLGNNLAGIPNEGKDKTESAEKTSKLNQAFEYFANSTSQPEKTISATDSQGYKAMAYNDRVSNLNASAIQFVAGAVGLLAQIYNPIRDWFNKLGGAKACGFLNSGVGQAVGLVVSLFAALLTMGASHIGATMGKEALKLAVIQIGTQVMIPIVAGKVVTALTNGEDYGNAVVSGAAALMAKNTVSGGGSGLTKEQAVAFYKWNETQIAERAEEERISRSPFDISTRHTFFGSIVSSSIPYISEMRTISGIIPSVLSITSRSFASILPSAKADNAANFRANMETCEDIDMKSLNVATDIFCNPYTGVDTNTLNLEFDQVVDVLQSNGHIDLEKEYGQELISNEIKTYEKECVGRDDMLGIGREIGVGEGKECVYSQDHKMVPYFSTYFTYKRAQDGMDSGVKPGGGNDGSSSTSLAGNAKNKDCKAGDLCWPIQSDNPESTITSPFGFYTGTTTPHHGIDFGAGGVTFGTPVYAIADGEVVGVGNQSAWGGPAWGYGPNILNGGGIGSCSGLGGGGGEQVVNLKHNIDGKDVYSFYIHMQKNSDLKVGQRISAGTQVGEVGSYGCSTGAHLHLEVKEGNINSPSVDPRKYL